MQTQRHPTLPRPVALATSAAFWTLARLRGARAFHPDGLVYRGRLVTQGAVPPSGSWFLDLPSEYDVLVRLSKAVGTPDGWPDILGVAVRVLDVDGPGLHRDLLFASSSLRPVARHMLIPTRRLDARPLSALLPYRTQQGLFVLAVTCEDAPEVSAFKEGVTPPLLTLQTATPTGSWRRVGQVVPKDLVAPNDSESLRFDPWNAGRDLRPAGFFNALRHPAYEGSRRGSRRGSRG